MKSNRRIAQSFCIAVHEKEWLKNQAVRADALLAR
jgi:hypothetical protein